MAVAANIPPTTAVPIEVRAPAPAPDASIRGRQPIIKASDTPTAGFGKTLIVPGKEPLKTPE